MVPRITQLIAAESYPAAEATIQEHFSRQPRPPIVDYWLGFIYLKTGRLPAAEAALNAALARRADRGSWHHALAWVLLEQGRYSAAAQSFARASELEPTSVAFQFDLASCALRMGDIPVADAALQRVLALEPSHAPGLAALGGLRLDQGDAASAHKLLQQALLQNSAPDLLFQFGVATRSLGDTPSALAAFAKVLEEVPGHVGALYNQAQLLHRIEPERARQTYARYQAALEHQELIENRQAYLRLSPDNSAARAELVDLLLGTGRTREAIDALDTWRRLAGERPEIWQRYAVAWQRLGRNDLAEAAANRATRP